jgi:hypothetical protein
MPTPERKLTDCSKRCNHLLHHNSQAVVVSPFAAASLFGKIVLSFASIQFGGPVMDMLHLPFLWYLMDFRKIQGTYTLGFIGLLVCLVVCYVCWRQIANEPDSGSDSY